MSVQKKKKSLKCWSYKKSQFPIKEYPKKMEFILVSMKRQYSLFLCPLYGCDLDFFFCLVTLVWLSFAAAKWNYTLNI